MVKTISLQDVLGGSITPQTLAKSFTKKELVDTAESFMETADQYRNRAMSGATSHWSDVHKYENVAEKCLEASYLVRTGVRIPRGYNRDGQPFY